MQVAHLLRKYEPAEWGGTETALLQLCSGLRGEHVQSTVYCPAAPLPGNRDPLAERGCVVRRYKACVPVWGISKEQRRQMVAVGGNLLSVSLLRMLWSHRAVSVIHSHTLGRIGGTGLTVARRRRIPFVVTVHGGLYDLPESLRRSFGSSATRGIEWGKPFGMLLRSRRVIQEADAIFTCNPREADLIRERHPDRRVIVQPHGVEVCAYADDRRADAARAFPQTRERDVILSLGRIDPVKNQSWIVEQMPDVRRRHPRALLVLAGACTDEAYGRELELRIRALGLAPDVLVTGRLPPQDPRLVGLLQAARIAVLHSISETFGLVILEAWAAGTPVLSSRTSGATALIQHGRNGWLFDLADPAGFHTVIDVALGGAGTGARLAAAGRERVREHYDSRLTAAGVRQVYQFLVEEKDALRNSSGR